MSSPDGQRWFIRGVKGAYTIWYRDVLRFARDRARIVASLGQPLLFLFVFGTGLSPAMSATTGGALDFRQFMFPGILAMAVLFTAIFSAISIVWDREFGFLKEILVAPIGRSGIVLGKAIGATITALLQVTIMLVLAPLLGVSVTPLTIVQLIPVVTILALGLSGLGILIASFMTSQQGFQLVIQLLIFPLIFLAGVFFPVNNVPGWLEVISKLNPLTYGVDAIRQIFLGSNASLGVTVLGHTMTVLEEVAVVGALGTILLGGAVIAFSRQE